MLEMCLATTTSYSRKARSGKLSRSSRRASPGSYAGTLCSAWYRTSPTVDGGRSSLSSSCAVSSIVAAYRSGSEGSIACASGANHCSRGASATGSGPRRNALSGLGVVRHASESSASEGSAPFGGLAEEEAEGATHASESSAP